MIMLPPFCSHDLKLEKPFAPILIWSSSCAIYFVFYDVTMECLKPTSVFTYSIRDLVKYCDQIDQFHVLSLWELIGPIIFFKRPIVHVRYFLFFTLNPVGLQGIFFLWELIDLLRNLFVCLREQGSGLRQFTYGEFFYYTPHRVTSGRHTRKTQYWRHRG